MTLEDAKEWLRAQFGKNGVACPCCGQYVKLYRRSVSCLQARGLIAHYHWNRKNNGQPMHVKHLNNQRLNTSNDYGTMRYWGLIEEITKDDGKDTRCSGLWNITDTGIDFVEGKQTIIKYIFTYNKAEVSRGGNQKGIALCLDKNFSYSELMNYSESFLSRQLG